MKHSSPPLKSTWDNGKEKTILSVKEYGAPICLQDYDLTPDDFQYLFQLQKTNRKDQNRFDLLFSPKGICFQALNWVGTIELTHVRIIVEPKFNNKFQSLIEMMMIAEEIPNVQERLSATTFDQNQNLVPLLIQLFLAELEILLQKRIHTEYVEEEENLLYVRGRVDFIQNVIQNFANPNRVYCQYDELSSNIAENQILLTCLYACRRYPLTSVLQRQVELYTEIFEEMCVPYEGPSFPQIQYHRLNANYRRSHVIADCLLRQNSVNDLLHGGNREFYSLLIDMNLLFEKFVFQLLKKYGPTLWEFEYQVESRQAIIEHKASKSKARKIQPDIVAKSQNKTIVLDTKYKHYGAKGIENADMYQLLFYAQHFGVKTGGKYQEVVLVYPAYAEEMAEQEYVIDLHPDTDYFTKLYVRSLSIDDMIQHVRKGRLDALEIEAHRLLGNQK